MEMFYETQPQVERCRAVFQASVRHIRTCSAYHVCVVGRCSLLSYFFAALVPNGTSSTSSRSGKEPTKRSRVTAQSPSGFSVNGKLTEYGGGIQLSE